MNFPFTNKKQTRITKTHVAAGVGAAAGAGLLAYGVKRLLDARKRRLAAQQESTALEARPVSSDNAAVSDPVVKEPVRGFASNVRPQNRVDRESFNSFPASDSPSHMPGVG